MSNLYSYKGAYPNSLPSNMSLYQLEDFLPAPEKPAVEPGNFLEWNLSEWVIRTANEAELAIQWTLVRSKRNALLLESDYLVVIAYEQGDPVSQELKDYRQALRDITLQLNPFAIEWPTK